MTEHKTLAEALLAFQADAPTLPKDGNNPHFKSKFTKLDTIREKIGPLLAEHGLAWQTFPCFGPNGEPALRYMLTHTGGDSQSDVMPLMLNKASAQELGSAITYARRYSVTAVLDLVADDDDDGSQASQGRNGGSAALTKEDIASLRAAAKGLKAAEIKLAFAAAGIAAPESVGPDIFDRVPKDRAAELALRLSKAEST